MKRPCLHCGVLIPTGSRCPTCSNDYQRRLEQSRDRPSANQRGYDADYQRARSKMKQSIKRKGSVPCHWCGVGLTVETFTADHDPPLRVAGPHTRLVPACRRCNFGRR